MRRMILNSAVAVVTAAGLCVIPCTLAPATAAVLNAPSDAAAIAKETREALKAINAISLEGRTSATGAGADATPAYRASTTAVRAEAGGWKLATTGGIDGQSKGAAGSFDISCDGVSTRSKRDSEQAVYESDAWEIDQVRSFYAQQNAMHPVPWEMLMDPPMPGLEAGTAEGRKVINGTPCDVILVKDNNIEGPGSTRYYIGVKDRLPRRIDRLRTVGEGPDAKEFTRTLTLNSIKTDKQVTPAVFTMTVPQGYRVRTVRVDRGNAKPEAPKPQERAARGLIAVGEMAPDWTLTSAEGDKVTLSKLRGQVVVLDFWATWCPPCREAMPEMQAMHDEFRKMPVQILGLNCWERGDPAAYMEKNKLNYPLLLKADDVARAYKVEGIPTFYVIGPDGKVLMAQSGLARDTKDKIRRLIRANLPN